MFLNLLLSLIVGIICLMSWMFKRNLEIDKETQILEKRILELEKSIEILFKLNHDLEYKLINFKQLLFKPKYD
jgi:hypothetical protein